MWKSLLLLLRHPSARPQKSALIFLPEKKSDGRRKAALTAASSSPCVVVLGRKVHMHFDKGAAVTKGEPATC